jgi:hypothetical protein
LLRSVDSELVVVVGDEVLVLIVVRSLNDGIGGETDATVGKEL